MDRFASLAMTRSGSGGEAQRMPKEKVPCVGMPNTVRVGRAGHGRHGGEAPALWGGPMMSALNFWSF